jgi:AcrR family transcriptional regulator
MARNQMGKETQERILAATRELLGEVGLDGATLKAICDRAGVRAGSFYNLFVTKDEAVLEVVREAIRAVDPHPAGEGVDTVEELVAAYVEFITGDPIVARIYLQIAVGGGLTDEDMGRRMLRHHEGRIVRFADAIGRADPGLTDEESRRRAEATVATLNGLAFHWLLDPRLAFDQHARRLASGIGAGLSPA